MGRHHFRYAIAPHKGSFAEASITRAGYNFNYPLKVFNSPKPETVNVVLGAITLEGPPNVVLETIKRGEEDGELEGHYVLRRRPGKSVIIRTYEALGGAAKSVLKTSLHVKKALKVNLLEDDLEELSVNNGSIDISHRPFEVTLRLQL